MILCPEAKMNVMMALSLSLLEELVVIPEPAMIREGECFTACAPRRVLHGVVLPRVLHGVAAGGEMEN